MQHLPDDTCVQQTCKPGFRKYIASWLHSLQFVLLLDHSTKPCCLGIEETQIQLRLCTSRFRPSFAMYDTRRICHALTVCDFGVNKWWLLLRLRRSANREILTWESVCNLLSSHNYYCSCFPIMLGFWILVHLLHSLQSVTSDFEMSRWMTKPTKWHVRPAKT